MDQVADQKTIAIRHRCGHVWRYTVSRDCGWSLFIDHAPDTLCPCCNQNPAPLFGGTPSPASARRIADDANAPVVDQKEARQALATLERLGIDASHRWRRWLRSGHSGWFYEADEKLAGADTLGYTWMVSDDGPEDDRWVDLTVVVVDEREDDENETQIAWGAKRFRVGTQHDPLELILRRAEFIRAKWVANQGSDEVRGWVAEAEAEAADQREMRRDPEAWAEKQRRAILDKVDGGAK